MKLFRNSNKKNLLITGSRGIGKSTLVREILRDEDNYGGIRTKLIKEGDLPREVILEDMEDKSKSWPIGKRIGQEMGPELSGFEDLGHSILKSLRKSDKDLIVIDEIGFLELGAENYQEEIMRCFRDKRLIAVLRKEPNPLINRIKSLENVFIVDLDHI